MRAGQSSPVDDLDLTLFVSEGTAALGWISAKFPTPIPASGAVCHQTATGPGAAGSVTLANTKPEVCTAVAGYC